MYKYAHIHGQLNLWDTYTYLSISQRFSWYHWLGHNWDWCWGGFVLEMTATGYLKLPIKISRRKSTLDFSGTFKDLKKNTQENHIWLKIKRWNLSRRKDQKCAFRSTQKAFLIVRKVHKEENEASVAFPNGTIMSLIYWALISSKLFASVTRIIKASP